jgi:AcrR family transcriptional regulator
MLKTFAKLSKEKQRQILDAAASVFAEKGFYRANVADICSRARISNGALYKYFKNKEDVYKSVVEYIHRGSQLLFAIEPNGVLATQKSAFTYIKELLDRIVRGTEKYPQYYKLYYDIGSPSMQPLSASFSKRLEEPSLEFCLKLAKEGKIKGEIDPAISTKIAALIIDNHLTLFMFSCVSEHHDERFRGFLGNKKKTFSKAEKVKLTLHSIKSVLKAKN